MFYGVRGETVYTPDEIENLEGDNISISFSHVGVDVLNSAICSTKTFQKDVIV
jgi:hypothetical protein